MCWATSYNWCCKNQVIDLFAEGFTGAMLAQLHLSVEVSEWFATFCFSYQQHNLLVSAVSIRKHFRCQWLQCIVAEISRSCSEHRMMVV